MSTKLVRRLAVVVLVAVAACVPRLEGTPSSVEVFTAGPALFRVYYVPQDVGSARLVISALRKAAPVTLRWGGLPKPVSITIHPTHDALERQIHREGYGWLRAWARYDSIDLQSPRTWSVFGATEGQVTMLLAHELTHCAMYQASATISSWTFKGIPLWFREGMASVSAGEAGRRANRDAVRRFYQSADHRSGGGSGVGGGAGLGSNRAGDPVIHPEPLYQSDSEIVYAAAHWAFQFLLDRYGEPRVREVLAAMRTGQPFATAFSNSVGLSQEEFEEDFKHYVLWHGWR